MKYVNIADDKVQKFIQIQLRKIGQLIKKMVPEVVSIVLSGSFSRGEGSIELLSEDIFIIQKDFDIFIFSKKIPDYSRYKLLKKIILKEIETSNNKNYSNKNFRINLEFINVNQLNGLLPDISTYELKRNGLVIFGKKLLHLIPESVSNFNSSTILRILLNKLIGLIENNPFFNKNSLNVAYECYKTYIEINTVLCILNRCYHTDYTNRLKALKKHWYKFPKSIKELDNKLLDKIENAVSFKLKPIKNLKNLDVEDFWFETKDLLIKIIDVIVSFFICNPEKKDSDENLITYLKKYYYFPYSQRFLHKFKIKSQFLNHLISKAYILLEKSRENLMPSINNLINLYLSSFFLLKAIKKNNIIDEEYFKEAKLYIKEKKTFNSRLENWMKLAKTIISLKLNYDDKKIKKKSFKLI
ncbi:MAG: hypothetical protein EAX96_20030 [Candidatus Lokiarchaeota archaeon]|nr:hypothetical protein [Candidatus Lokiarchaeota archaeon]